MASLALTHVFWHVRALHSYRNRNINMLDFRRSDWYADELNFEPNTKTVL